MKRKLAILIKKYLAYEILIVVASLLIQILQGVLSFTSENATTFPGLGGEKLNPYTLFNILNIISIFLLVILAIWIYVKNAPPLVDIKEHNDQDMAYIRLKNNDPVDLECIQVKMGGLALDNMENGWDMLDLDNLLKIEQRIGNGERKNIPIANGKKGYTQFSVDNGLCKIPLRNLNEKKPHGTYRIALEISVRPVGGNNMLVGRFMGIIYHTEVNMQGNRDVVGWEKGSLKKVSKKDYFSFVRTKHGLKYGPDS